MFDDPISSNELIEAARDNAKAVAFAENTAVAAREADTTLAKADIAAVIAINNDWEANLNKEQCPPRREMGFGAEVNTDSDRRSRRPCRSSPGRRVRQTPLPAEAGRSDVHRPGGHLGLTCG